MNTETEKNDLLLEIHTHLFEKERVYPFEMGKIWEAGDAFLEKAEFAPSLNCLVLMPAHSLWLMAMHNAFRRTACRYMLTLRYISDMEYLIRRAKADWSVFS